MHVGYGYDDYCVSMHAVNYHVRKFSHGATTEDRSDGFAALGVTANTLKTVVHFANKERTQALSLCFIPGECFVELKLRGSKKPDLHRLYFSKTSEAGTDVMIPAW